MFLLDHEEAAALLILSALDTLQFVSGCAGSVRH